MRAAQLDATSTVVNFAEVQAFDGVRFIAPLDAVLGSVWDGAAFSHPAPPAVSPDEIARQIEDRLDADLDAIAAAWGYKDSTRLASYAASTNAQWKAEADAFLAGRDAWWTKAAQLQAAWTPGAAVPTYEDVRAQMPAIDRPAA